MNQSNGKTLVDEALSKISEAKLSEFRYLFEKEGIKKFLNNQELVKTFEFLLDNNLNICKTSEKTFMHRNTLLYRINKIKKLTNYDAKVFADAISLHTLLILYKNYTKNEKL